MSGPMTYKKLVRLLGPSRDIQQKLNVTRQRVYNWRKSNEVPPLIAYQVRDYLAEQDKPTA